jgi:hypothetical protein
MTAPFKIPSSWAWGTLRDVVTHIEAGKSFACEPRPAGPNEWGIIKVSAMTWGEFRQHENKAVPADREINPAHEIRPGDILVSRANTEAYVGAPVLVRKCRPRLLLSDKSLRLNRRRKSAVIGSFIPWPPLTSGTRFRHWRQAAKTVVAHVIPLGCAHVIPQGVGPLVMFYWVAWGAGLLRSRLRGG